MTLATGIGPAASLLAASVVLASCGGGEKQSSCGGAAPDLIAFSSARATPATGSLDIYVVAPDGTGLCRLTSDPAPESNPAWSPDRKRIAFVRATTDGSEIYVMNADGSRQHRLRDDPGRAGSPAWSPDGRRIAWVSRRPGHKEQVYVMNADGSDERQLTGRMTAAAHNDSPTWSFDGRRIAFESTRGHGLDIYLMNAQGPTQVRPLTSNPCPQSRRSPAWSPDGRRIAFAGIRGLGRVAEIYVMNADGSEERRLTTSPDGLARFLSSNDDPVWSPDGQSIAFAGASGRSDWQIYVMNADGSRQRRLTNDPGGVKDPAWASGS